MKSYNHLFEKLIAYENLDKAIERSSKEKKDRRKVKQVLKNKDKVIKRLQYLLLNQKLKFRKHKVIQINDGSISKKQRLIVKPDYIYEQILHHAIVQVLMPMFFKGMYNYSCGSIPGRGGIYGKRYLEKYIRENPSKSKYCLKCDIRHFYQSIDINMLKDKLSQKIHDARMLHILFLVLDSNIVIHKGKDINIGLPIGYYTSQWFANWYLQELDHYIKEDLKINCYVRYVDDLVMLSNNKKHLHKSLKSLKEYFKDLELEIKGNYQVFRLVYTDKYNKVRGRPIDFMGFKFFKDKTIIRKSIFMKAMKTIRKVSKKEYITVHEAYQIISILGWFKHTDSYMVYQEKVKPFVNIGKCKRIISNHTKRKGSTKCN